MSDLAEILARLYPDRDRVRFFLLDPRVGLNPEEIDLEGSSLLRWRRVLDEAWKFGRVGVVVAVAAEDFESRREELTEALGRYLVGRSGAALPPGRVTRATVTAPGLLRFSLDRWLPRLHGFLTRRVGRLPEPAELPELEDYLRRCASRIRNEMRAKTYLPLSGREVPSRPTDVESGRDPFVLPIHQVIRELVGRAQGGDSASVQIAAANRRSRVVRNILQALDRWEDPLILLGEPGSGKTMTLQKAALTLAEAESRRVFPRVTIFVRLGEFHVEGKTPDDDDVRRFVERSVPPSIRDRLDSLAHSGRLVLFFDGMDEMSRERYGEHTEALSVFAGRTPAKTLFSCRVTDFSPKFVHRRLVLLPFDRSQVAEYLGIYIETFPVLIDGRRWKRGALADRIARGGLPIEATNPFVLWLLCLYLQEESSWPASRVELLHFYNERNYRRKEEGSKAGDVTFPPMEDAFRAWAEFAYQITERNRGPAIPVREVESGRDAAMVRDLILVGKRCGILAESRDRFEHLIRFEHHRFQEYFAALHIHGARPDVAWLDKLDAPRWQETMLNLILMGGGDDALHAFAASIDGLSRSCEAEIAPILDVNRRREQREWKLKPLKVALPDRNEVVFSDRVELTSRILRQIGPEAADVRGRLMPPFRRAIGVLAEYGNPITQVKIMRACQNEPEVDFIEAMRVPLQSPVRWVRNQALIVMASGQAGARAVGADLATEMAYDLASGNLPVRLPAYWKAVCSAAAFRAWWVLLVGATCYLGKILLLVAGSILIYAALFSLKDVRFDLQRLNPDTHIDSWKRLLKEEQWGRSFHGPKPKPLPVDFGSMAVLGHPACVAVGGLFVLTVAGLTLRREPALLCLAVLGSTTGYALLSVFVAALWKGSVTTLFVVFIEDLFFLLPIGSLACFLLGAATEFGLLAAYLAASAPIRRSGQSIRTYAGAAWDVCGFSETFVPLRVIISFLLGTPVVYVIGLAVLYMIFPLCQLLSDLSYLPFHPLVNAVICVLLGFGVGAVLKLGVRDVARQTRELARRTREEAREILSICAELSVIAALAGVTMVLLYALYLWVPFWLFLRLLQALALLLVAPIALFLLVQNLAILKRLARSAVLRHQKYSPGSFKAEDWVARIGTADADGQDYLLSRTDHQALSLTPAAYLEVLKQVAPAIKKEPALSTYWEQRDQLEQVLKQERQG